MNRKNAKPRAKTVLSLSALALLITSGVLYAGPLNPPPGPVTSTYKTLTEVEPRIAINPTNTPGDADSLFKITQPGSYYLTGNITGVVGKHGIEIASSGVTLDLNGFDLAGIPAMGTFDGVSATVANLTNIAVVNGSVRNWGQDGVNLDGTVRNSRIHGVNASGNVRVGISAGNNCQVSACSALGGQYGIYTGTSCVLSDCSAAGASAFGFLAGSSNTLANCSSDQSAGAGIQANVNCTLTNCSAYHSATNGIIASNGSTLTSCSAYSNTGNGIQTQSGCSVVNCSAYLNVGDGINVASDCTVENCTVTRNVLDGIQCGGGCTIRNNNCSLNGNSGDGAGIHVLGIFNRIEGNNSTFADRGIDVDAARNIIIRNTCSGNTTDWDIVANNVFGPIIDRRAPASAAVVGFSAASSLGSTDPNANFSY